MKEGWTYEKLGEVCEIFGRIGFRGYTRKDYVNTMEEGAISLSPSNIKNNQLVFSNCTYITWDKYNQSPEIMISKGDVVFVKTASIGKCAYVSELPHETTINPQFVAFKNIKISNRFLFHQLQSPSFQNKVKSITTGTSVPTISQKGLSELEISYPDSISEQERIVERLDAAFAQIDELKSNAEKQLAEARALFQSALTQAMQPKPGWQEKTLKEIGLTQTGTTPSKSDKSNYGNFIPFIRPSEIDFDGCGGINYDCEMKLSEKGLSIGRLFKKHSVLMVCIGATISKVGFSTQDISCNQQINVLYPCDKYHYKYIYYAMRNDDFKRKVIKEGTSAQATLPIINKSKWENLTLFVPDIEEQQRISNYLDSLASSVRELEEISRKTAAECDALKQALLRQIFE